MTCALQKRRRGVFKDTDVTGQQRWIGKQVKQITALASSGIHKFNLEEAFDSTHNTTAVRISCQAVLKDDSIRTRIRAKIVEAAELKGDPLVEQELNKKIIGVVRNALQQR